MSNWAKLPSKQKTAFWIPGGVISPRDKPDLLGKSFLVTGVNSNLNVADDHKMRSEKDIDTIFDNKE